MEWSNYVISFEYEKYVLLYKSITDTLFAVSREEYFRIVKYLNENDKKCLSDKDKTDISELFLNGLIVENKEVEIEEFRQYHAEMKSKETYGTVYFAPSFACNLMCTYCIIGENVGSKECIGRMNVEQSKQAARYTYNRAVKRGIRNLNAILYGGEPMLSYDNVVAFIDELTELNVDEKIKIEYTLITNGYYMPDEKVSKLVEKGVRNLQITLDGPERIHDKRRILANGLGSFGKILSNLEKYCSAFARTVIRVNVDNENAPTINELIDILAEKELYKKCVLHFNLVDPSDYSDISGYNEETYGWFESIYEHAFECGFDVAPWRRHCSWGSNMYISIDKDGNIYDCPNIMGDSASAFGNISSTKGENVKRTMLERCYKCCYVGICNGGCDVMRKTSIVGSDFCFKEANTEMTRHFFNAKYQKRRLSQANRPEAHVMMGKVAVIE